MTDVVNFPFFSVVLPTRNRPALLMVALKSVLDQDFADREVIVVVDGSDEGCLRRYREIESRQPEITFDFLAHRLSGHGQSYSMNVGAALSKGRYLCFLDDDDCWTDPGHLSSVHTAILRCDSEVDAHYSNQRAYSEDGSAFTDPLWLDDLVEQVEQGWEVCAGCYRVDAEFIMSSAGFAHLNCSILRREFFEELGRMDESIRYENDRDVFIRAVDTARTILYSTRYMSRHNIPDANRKQNLSTEVNDIEKKLYQMRVYDKAICLCRQPSVINACRRSKTYELKHMASILAARGRHASAAHYAREACLSGFNLRWLGYTLYLSLVALLRP
jgi:glycosyltransferase involved in cell wall biosynthesis